MEVYHRLVETGSLTNRTVLALHDTNTWPLQYGRWGCNEDGLIYNGEGYVHQVAERRMVNDFKDLGYDVFLLHPDKAVHNDRFPLRHGLAICQKFQKLDNHPQPLPGAEAPRQPPPP